MSGTVPAPERFIATPAKPASSSGFRARSFRIAWKTRPSPGLCRSTVMEALGLGNSLNISDVLEHGT